jgi:hypothetical protein
MEDRSHADQAAADPSDRAGAETDASNQEAYRNHQLAAAASGVLPEPLPSGLCSNEDCGEEVEPGRRALGLGRCLACAKAFDSLSRLRGRR